MKFKILLALNLFLAFQAAAQLNCELLDACGDINPSGGFPSGTSTSFCEGETVTFANTTADADSTYFNWGDGTLEGFAGTPNGVHVYNIKDTCLSGGFVQIPIVMTVVKHCANGTSRNCLISFIKIKVKPLADFGPDDVLCVGQPIDFENNTCENGSSTTYSWTVNPGGFASTDENITVTFPNKGNVTVTLTATNTCGPDVETKVFFVKGLPEVNAITPTATPTSGCAPVKIKFAATVVDVPAGTGYEWSVTPPSGCSGCFSFVDTTSKDSPMPKILFTKKGVYEVCLTASNECGTASRCITVEVFEPPGANVPAPPIACNSLDFTPNPTFSGSIDSYAWDFPGATPPVSSTLQNPGTVHYEAANAVVNDTATLIVKGPCGEVKIKIPITVTPKVTLSITPPAAPVCVGSAAFPVQVSHPGGLFSGGPHISSTGLFTPPNIAGQYPVHYEFPPNAPPNCKSEADITITVLAGTSLNLSGPAQLCIDGQPVNFTATPSGAGMGAWLPLPGLTDLNAGTFDPALAGAGDHVLKYHFEAANSCVTEKTIPVNVVALPTLQAPDTLRSCHVPQGVNLLSLGGSAFQFSPAGGAIAWTGNGMNPQTGVFTSAAPDTLTVGVTYTLQPGPPGCSVRDSFVLAVTEFVAAGAGADDEVCQSQMSYQLNGSPAGGQWSGPGVDAQTGLVNLQNVPTGVPQTYTYTIQAGTPCESKASAKLTVYPGDGVQTPPEAWVCETASTFTLPAGTPGNGTWSGQFQNNGSVDVSQLQVGQPYTYIYMVAGLPPACNSAELQLNVAAQPDGGFVMANDTLCTGAETTFSASAAQAQGLRFEWDFGDGTTSDLPNPTHAWASAGNFTVKLTVVLSNPLAPGQVLCSNFSQKNIVVVAPPNVNLMASDLEICPQDGILFSNQSTGEAISGYVWDFGNGLTFNGLNPPDSIFYQAGIEDTTYTATLTAAGTCPDASASLQILVHPFPRLRLVPDVDSTCSGDTISFSLATTGDMIFNINFSANDTATTGLPLPHLTFFTPNDSTNLTVMAIVSGENLCALAHDTVFVEIYPNEAQAFLDLSVPVICVGDTLQITNGATPIGAQVFYDFGDGTTSAEPNPRKVYAVPGVFKIRQSARTICGFDFVDRFVRVNPAPETGFAHDAYACAGDAMHFWLTTDSSGRTFNWDFGFGKTSQALRPEASFPFDSVFPVTLTATLDSSGCDASLTKNVEIKPNPTANFTASDTSACGELHTTLTVVPGGGQFFEWTTSDGNSASGNPANLVFQDSGTFEVRLFAKDVWGCDDDTSRRIFHVWPLPKSDFSMSKNWHCGDTATVQLTETASPDAIDFDWKFSDGTTSVLNNPSKTFTQPGDYPILLTVKNIFECENTAEKLFRVFAQPLADFEIVDPTPCQFEVLGIENLSENANRWLWTFGNVAGTDTSRTPNFAFQTPGVFDISLVAMRDSFCFDTFALAQIVDIKPAPLAGFFAVDSMPNGYPAGLVYVFSTATNAEKWHYDFGNGQSADTENAFVKYGQNLPYAISQIVTNALGCTDTAFLGITPAPFGGLYVPNAFAPESGEGDYAFFMPKGKGLAEYRVRVFSPTGERVFESDELLNGSPGKGWDGKDLGGKPCQQGAYAWVIEAEYETAASRAESLDAGSKRIVEMGSVLLIR